MHWEDEKINHYSSTLRSKDELQARRDDGAAIFDRAILKVPRIDLNLED